MTSQRDACDGDAAVDGESNEPEPERQRCDRWRHKLSKCDPDEFEKLERDDLAGDGIRSGL